MARTTRSLLRVLPLQPPPAVLTTARRRLRAETAGGRLHGRTLGLARAAWLAVAVLTLALYGAGVWRQLGRLHAPCLISRLGTGPARGMCVHGQVPPAVAQAFDALHLSVGFYGGYALGLNVLVALGFAAVAAVLVWRRSSDPLALLVALTLLLFGTVAFESGLVASGLPAVSPGWRLPVEGLEFLGEVAFGLFIAIFPDGRFVPEWSRLGVVAVALWFLPTIFFPGSSVDFVTWPGVAFLGGWAVLFSLLGTAQVDRYLRVSTRIQQQQTKWVILGFGAAGVGYLGGGLVGFLLPLALTTPQAILADLAGGTLIYGSLLLVPATIGVAMLRYHLYDIDVLIRRTLIYSLVTGTLATVYALSSIVLQASFYAVTRQGSALATVGSTLAIAALFQPVRGRVQAAVDRRFYRRKYDAARTVEAFGQALQSEVDLARLTHHLVAVVEETMQPSQVSLWLARPTQPTLEGEPPGWQREDPAKATVATRATGAPPEASDLVGSP
jgi:hypothetical protein